MINRLHLAAVSVVLMAPPAVAAPQGPPHYTVTDLGVGLRTSESGPVGLNDSGDIAGTLDASATSAEHRAFVYHRGRMTLLSDRDMRAAAINNRGEVACFSRSGVFLWDRHRMRELAPRPNLFGSLAGPGGDLYVTGLNNKGEVVGSVFGLDGVFTPFLWQNAKFVGRFPARQEGPTPFSFTFEPSAINDRSQIVGFTHRSMIGGPPSRAVLWDNGRTREAAGAGAVFPYALNNKGQSVGMMYVGTSTHAFLWDGSGTVQDLGTVGGDRSEADGINDQGQIVGTADIHHVEVNGLNSVGWGGGRAVLWQRGQSYDLNDLIPKASGWVLEKAVGINSRGQIVGTGQRSRDGRSMEGGTRILLLTPRR